MDRTNNITVVAGGYLGDEGKGKITQFFLERTREAETNILCIRSSGGTNTGATVYFQQTKIGVHMLPIGAFIPHVDCYIGNGVYVNFDVLIKELKERQRLAISYGFVANLGRIFLSKYAHVVTPSCLERDAEKEQKQNLGSTKNGVSIAASDKYSYRGVTVQEWLAKSPDIRDWLDEFYVQVVEPYDLLSELSKTHNIVLEGTQGIGLDVNHGFQYPYVSAGSFSTFGLLDGVGYALAPTEVCMVLKTYGSYFGPLRMGAADFNDDDFRKYAREYGTTTHRPRNLCWLDGLKLKKAASHIRPSMIALNRLDTLNWFAENNKQWSIMLDDGHSMTFDDRAFVDGRLTNSGALFVEVIEDYVGAPVKLLGVGPKHSDIIQR